MPRKKRTQLDHDFLYERWRIFGNWLTLQRLDRGLTQNEAAKAVKVSRQQWLRYESGAKVLRKRMPAMATALDVSLEKMLDRAGYKTSPKRNAAKDRLGGIHRLLCAGKIDLAILSLLRLNDRIEGNDSIEGGRTGRGPKAGGVAATNFARAVALLDELPDWLLELALNAMKERSKDMDHETETHPRVKSLIRKKCIEALRAKKVTLVYETPPSSLSDSERQSHRKTQWNSERLASNIV
jgi:transcriptional regulator with XRE-family HTH domain